MFQVLVDRESGKIVFVHKGQQATGGVWKQRFGKLSNLSWFEMPYTSWSDMPNPWAEYINKPSKT